MLLNVAQLSLIGALALGSLAIWTAIITDRSLVAAFIPYERRRSVPWNGLYLFVAIVFFLFIPDAITISFANYLELSQEHWISDPRCVLVSQIARLISTAALAPILWFGTGADIDDLGLDTRRLGRDFKIGALAMVAFFGPVIGTQGLLTQLLPSDHPVQKILDKNSEPWVVAAMGLVAVVIAPLVEEFFFRVILQGWLEAKERHWRRKLHGRWPLRPGFLPICGSSLLFAALHAGYGPDPVPIFMLALFLGYLYYRTHRLWPSVAAHFCLNAFSMIIMILHS